MGKTISKLIPHEISNTLNKIIPNEIKPALPYAAAALPVLGGLGYLGAGIGSLSGGQLAALSAAANAGSQMSQEGYDKRGLNVLSTGLAGLGGYLSGAGTAGELSGIKTLGNIGDYSNYMNNYSNIPGIDDLGQLGYNIKEPVFNTFTAADASKLAQQQLDNSFNPILKTSFEPFPSSIPENSILTPTTTLQDIQNTVTDLGSSAANYLRPEEQPGFLGTAQRLIPGATAAATEQAYNKAKELQDEYDKKMGNIKNMTQADLAERRKYVIQYMQLAGFNQDQINSALSRQGLMMGGRAGYEAGSNNEGIKTIPINLDAIAKQLFNDKLDNLTYTQKESVYNRYYDLKDKKAKGGLMSLGGHEMDFRAAGGFVPIGKKERADDVPARLSKNEFVFTAKAVRNAGHGDIKAGAKRMYQLMKHLEAR